MSFDPNICVAELRENGLTVVPNAFSESQCAIYREKLINIARKRAELGKIKLAGDCHNVWNFFRYDEDLMPLVFNKYFDGILKLAVDEDYVAIAINAINRQVLSSEANSYGDYWHNDSRIVGGRRLDYGFTFNTTIMLEDFTVENAATQYVPKSHKDRSVPDRQGNYDYKNITGPAGTLVVWDSGLWHRGGKPSDKSRWGVFSMYGPWFVKPYWRYWDMIGQEKGAKLSPDLRRLFHFDSTPPKDDDERLSTLAKNYR